MIVIAASKIAAALSHSVFSAAWRPTRPIMRSRNDSPGCSSRRRQPSLSTRVPPVTALRSPPLSRMTGFRHYALSSTEATPQ
jgi:hypothetical protein